MSTTQTLFGLLGALALAIVVVLLLRRQEPFFDMKDEFEEPAPPPRGPSPREVEYDTRATALDERLARNEITEAEHAELRATLAARFERGDPLA